MQKVDYAMAVETPLDLMWDFIKDFSNWAPMVKGYQSHEVVNERESIWVIKGQFGSFSRLTKFYNTITEWVPGERVAFKLIGMNEPVEGYGIIELRKGKTEYSSELSAEVGFQAGGAMGPLINRMIKPWVLTVAEELATKIVAAISPEQKVNMLP